MKNISVLLVDAESEAYMRFINCEALHTMDCCFVVDYASNGYEAIEAFKFLRYDLVLTENQLSDMSGIDLMKSLKALKSKACIAVFSQSDNYIDVRPALINGAADYLLKSSEMEDLLKNLIDILEAPMKDMSNKLHVIANDIGESIKESILPKMDQVKAYYDLLIMDFPYEGDMTHRIAHGLEMVLEKLDFSPIDISLSYVAKRCSEWICDQEMKQEAFMQMISWIQKAYEEIMLPFISNLLTRQAIYYVLESSESKKTVAYIAQKLFVNRSYLSEVFKQKANISLSAYIARVKMYGALVLLLDPGLTKLDILHVLEIKDDAHFNANFKSFTGWSALEYKQRMLLARRQ